jgi:PAS domain S-box-containing protein
VRAYLGLVLAAFIVIGVIGTFYVSADSHHTGVDTARTNVTVAAQSGAAQADSALAGYIGTVVNLTSGPEASQLLVPSTCHQELVQLGGSSNQRMLSIVSDSGAVLCTSAGHSTAGAYVGASWLGHAATAPGNFGPYHDSLGGYLAIITAAPIAGTKNLVVQSQSLAPVASLLANLYGGPDHISFVFTTADNKTILSSSLSQANLSGRSVGATPFTVRGSADVARNGVTGLPMFMSEATVGGLGWHLFAGEDASVALAPANHLRSVIEQILIIGILLLALILIIAYRTVTRPIFALTRGLMIPEGESTPAPVGVEGPIEVAAIGRSINTLIEEVNSELAQRRAAEVTALESSDSYQTLFEANPLPMVLIDSETLKFVDVNDAAIAAYGYRWHEFRNLSGPDLWLSNDPSIADSIRGDRPADSYGPVNHKRKDGSLIRVLVTSRTINFEGRQARFSLYEDVTERERLLRLAEQNQRLESLGQLAGGVAHDFNNLLSIISNYADFVKESPIVADDAATLSDVEQIIRASARAAELTTNLLRFARQEVVEPRPFDVNVAVTDVQVMLHRTLGDHVTLKIDLDDDDVVIVADPGQFEQVLVNLAVNARDAMLDGGTLTITTAPHPVRYGSSEMVRGVAAGKYVRVSVTDTGCGMTEEQRQHAFEPFFTTKETGRGTGLGLSTVYGIVTAAGGDISIDSVPDVGTTVSMLFPTSSIMADPEHAHLDKGKVLGSGQLVLVVDDEPAIGKIAQRILRGAGYRVEAAMSGGEGLALLDDGDPVDLLISDLVMPEMSGVDLARELQSRTPSARVLFMSGYADPVLGPIGAVPDDLVLLLKPFSEEDLLTRVAEVLSAEVAPSS